VIDLAVDIMFNSDDIRVILLQLSYRFTVD